MAETIDEPCNRNRSSGNPKQKVVAFMDSLEFHVLINGFYSLSDEIISCNYGGLFKLKLTDATSLAFKKQKTSLTSTLI